MSPATPAKLPLAALMGQSQALPPAAAFGLSIPISAADPPNVPATGIPSALFGVVPGVPSVKHPPAQRLVYDVKAGFGPMFRFPFPVTHEMGAPPAPAV